MEQIFKTVAAAALAIGMASSAQAACYADYKAKKNDGGLQLHYGVLQLADGACANRGLAQTEITTRIGMDGWVLLVLLGTFDETQLNSRQADAGPYFLKY